MWKSVISVVLGSLLALMASGHDVKGQNPSPSPTGTPLVAPTSEPALTSSPTASPTIGPPSGPDLIVAMKSAVKEAGSVRAAGSVSLELLRHSRIVENITANTSWTQAMVKLSGQITQIDFTKPPKSTSQMGTYVEVATHSASKLGRAKWLCETSSRTLKNNLLLLAGFLYTKKVGALNLGAAIVDSVPVWHVRAIQTSRPIEYLPPTRPLQADLYISQTDNTVVRETWSLTVATPTARLKQSLTLDYSNYGEMFSATLPKACLRPARNQS